MKTVKLGTEVYVKEPRSLISDCESITGEVVDVAWGRRQQWCTIIGYVAKMGGGYPIFLSVPYMHVGVRIGTPISQISTQPGTPGYEEWVRISRSWGYE